MKNIRIFAVLAAAISALLAPCAQGQTGTESADPVLPDHLPIGSEREYLDCVVSAANFTLRDPIYSITLYFTNRTDGMLWHTVDWAYDWHTTNWDEYISVVQDKGMALVDRVKKTGLYLEGTKVSITMVINTFPAVPFDPPFTGYGFTGIFSSNKYQTLAHVTKESLAAMKTDNSSAFLPIKDLEEVYIEVDTGPLPCWYRWKKGDYSGTYTSTWPTIGSEETKPGYLDLSFWYAAQKNYRARISLTVAGKTATYTQHGAMLKPAVSSMTSTGRLAISMPRGSDVTILSSSDLQAELTSWTTVKTLSWFEALESATIDVGFGSPCRFYTAIAR